MPLSLICLVCQLNVTSERTCASKALEVVICVKGGGGRDTQRGSGPRPPPPPLSLIMRTIYSTGGFCTSQCSHLLHVPVTSCPLPSRPGSGVSGTAAQAHSHWSDQLRGRVLARWRCLNVLLASERWHEDGTEVFRLAAPRQVSLNGKPVQLPSHQGVHRLLFNLGERTTKYSL